MSTQRRDTTKKGDKARKRILETASAMMAERGPDGVSMREISMRLKVTKPVIYYYFKNKEELIRAAFLEGTRHFHEIHARIKEPGLTLEQRLDVIFSGYLDLIKRYPDLPKCALKIMASPSSGVLATMAMELKKQNQKTIEETLGTEAEKEGFSKAGIAALLHLVSAVIRNFMIEARESGMRGLDKALPRRLAKAVSAGARALALTLLLLPSGPGSASALDLTVDEAVATALKNNAAVVTAEEARLIYKEKIREYWGTVFPQLSAGGQYTRNISAPSFFLAGNKIKVGLKHAYSGSLDLDQVLWSGGKVRTGIRMANMYAADSEEQLKTARSGVAKAVKQMYYSVLLSSAFASIQRESLDLARQHLTTIEAQYRQGVASDLSVLRQTVEVSNTEPALTQAQNLYESGLIEFKNLLGLDPETDMNLTGELACSPARDENLEKLYKAALLNRPEYRDARIRRDLYRETIKLERAGHFPYLGAFASRQFQGQTDSGFPKGPQRAWSTTAGLRLSLPIFSGGSTSSKVRQARLQAEIADTELRELERKIKISVKKAWLGLKEASIRLESQTTSVETARKVLAATEVRFKNGLASQLELNDASLALNRSRTLFTQARHDACSADAELRWTLGE